MSWQQTGGASSGVNGVLRVIDLREAAPAEHPFNSAPAVFEPADDSGGCCTLRLHRPGRLAGIALLSNARLIEVYKRVGSRPSDEYLGTGAPSENVSFAARLCGRGVRFGPQKHA